MTAAREIFMEAAKQSLQAMWPARRVERGLQDLAQLGDAALRQGVFCLVAESTDGWAEFTGREGEYGTLAFSCVAYLQLADDATTLQVEQAEAVIEDELLQWCRAIKTGPLLDAVYPLRVSYSGGLDAPLGWIVMRLEGGYV